MKLTAKYSVARAAGILALALLIEMPCIAVRAQNMDPFQTDPGTWKSFDRYKDEQKQKLFSEMTGDLDADTKNIAARDAAEAQSAAAEADEKKASAAASAAQTAASNPAEPNGSTTELALAPPERPLSPPLLPDMSARFNVNVDTTEDDRKPEAIIANIDSKPDIALPKQNWLDAAEAARTMAEGGNTSVDKNKSLNVRISFLPSFKAPSPQRKVPTPPAPVVAKQEPPPKPKVDTAACAAIDAYNKRQLEAIQSDRQTLSALKSAISELGLKKELNFMVGDESKVDAPTSP